MKPKIIEIGVRRHDIDLFKSRQIRGGRDTYPIGKTFADQFWLLKLSMNADADPMKFERVNLIAQPISNECDGTRMKIV